MCVSRQSKVSQIQKEHTADQDNMTSFLLPWIVSTAIVDLIKP